MHPVHQIFRLRTGRKVRRKHNYSARRALEGDSHSNDANAVDWRYNDKGKAVCWHRECKRNVMAWCHLCSKQHLQEIREAPESKYILQLSKEMPLKREGYA